jgi:adenylate cyclase
MIKRSVEFLLSLGAYPGESEDQRAGRRIVVAGLLLSNLGTVPSVLSDAAAGYIWVAAANAVIVVLVPVLLIFLNWAPHRFGAVVNVMFVSLYLLLLFEATAFGGLLESGITAVYVLTLVVGALVALGIRAAMWWFVAFIAAVLYSVLIPNWIDPIYLVEDPTLDAAFNLVAAGVVVFAVTVYFVRQRDHFQKESDDLLHNILPDEIVARLKTSSSMIADSFDSASVLFADVVGFTPMSAGMPPDELVGLLNSLFSTLDRLVEGLGLQKIKTVGDGYMVASGIPSTRPDHAQAIADLALRIRDELARSRVDGHQIQMRIGINSGPVVAGIIGTHKFAYDLWGDVVNIASRMESEGIGGSIQISEATYQLISEEFVCEPRGSIPVKGKGTMQTYLLLSRRGHKEAPPSRP